MNIKIKYYLSAGLLLGGFLFFSSAVLAGPRDQVNEAMEEYADSLESKMEQDLQNLNGCEVSSEIQSLSGGYGLRFLFNGNEVLKLISTQSPENAANSPAASCLKANSHVYVFLDTSGDDACDRFGLCDHAYVTYSSDGGKQWSELRSMKEFSAQNDFVIPQAGFFGDVRVLGDIESYALVMYNHSDQSVYLFDPELTLLRILPFYQQLSELESPSDFYFHAGVIYLVRGSCEITENNKINCPDSTYFETSKDYGKTWEVKTIPHVEASQFATINKSLYHFYLEECSTMWTGFVPALERSSICGLLKVRKLTDGQWGEPKTLLRTVRRLDKVYVDEQPVLVWQDYRFYRTKMCAFIPVTGCGPFVRSFKGPDATYVGKLDMNTLKLKEFLINKP